MLLRTLALAGVLVSSGMAALDCSKCHSAISSSFARTAHANASHVASADTIAGSFVDGANEMRTRAKGVFFRMEKRANGFYQTGFDRNGARTERFDLVLGSGRRGQSYLYWRNGLLFQLPVSYHAGTRRWINSPGYADGEVHFGRGIPPQCLSCHAANFRLEKTMAGVRYAEGYSLGIGCAVCHGSDREHEKIRRAAGIETCARCHSGLDAEPEPEPDVHGNQVGLLRSSKCFQKSKSMSCVTCHNVHEVQRDPVAMSAMCGACHKKDTCPQARQAGGLGSARCVECHMPVQQSKLIEVQAYRSHRIAIYRKR